MRFALCLPVLFCAIVGCDDGDTTEPGDSDVPPDSSVAASSGAGPGVQTCDGTTFSCNGFCNTQQTCGQGVCLPAPLSCNGACDGACGCDGVYYCNACIAHQFGVDVVVDGTCSEPPPTDRAFALGPDPVRVVLLQFDPVADVCVQVVLIAAEGGLPFDVTLPEPWSVESARATDHALDCNVTTCALEPLLGNVADAIGVTGTISIVDAQYPSQLSGSISVEFDETPWLDEPVRTLGLASPQLCF